MEERKNKKLICNSKKKNFGIRLERLLDAFRVKSCLNDQY
jgi:hypothetical protein